MANSNPLKPLALCGILLVLSGCSSGVSPEGLQDAEASLTAGLAAVEAQNWTTAEDALTAAISGPGLQPDLYEIALIARARTRVESGNLDGAAADLKQLEMGAAAMDQVLLVKGELALKQNDPSAAKVAFQDARKLNPKIVLRVKIP